MSAYKGNDLSGLFVDLFLDAHKKPAKRIVSDLGVTDGPLHGHQEGCFFHGYYDCYCYLPLYIFCGRHLLVSKLRPVNIDASAGTPYHLRRLVNTRISRRLETTPRNRPLSSSTPTGRPASRIAGNASSSFVFAGKVRGIFAIA